jgi:hypothetical protein
MRLLILFITLLSAPTVVAQQPAPEQKPPVTLLTGCLVSSGADTAVAGPSGRLYTLEVLEAPSQPSPSATGTTPPVASKTTYSLSAPESLNLAKHDGHEVQLTGSLQAPAPQATPGTGGATTSKPGGAHRTFNVTALKMVAAKCRS